MGIDRAQALQWANQHAASYHEGFMAMYDSVPYTNFQAEGWKMGWKSAWFIFTPPEPGLKKPWE